MKRVVFCTNLPSPYRVDFFNELGKYCNLTVLYERHTSSERDAKWKGAKAKNYQEIYLNLKPVGTDRSKGPALKNYIKTAEFDILILTNYVSFSTMEAMLYCRTHKIPYCIEYDGGFNKKDSIPKHFLKKILLYGAKAHLTTSEEHKKYLMELGIDNSKIYKYPFSSITSEDMTIASAALAKGKAFYREKLNITENKVLLSVGRFSYLAGYGKGYDILLKVCRELDNETGVYIVGDEPTEEFKELKKTMQLDHLYFIGFKTKDELRNYYAAADVFILLSRGDVWGLVINEAMTYGLPIITTPYCIAGKELVHNDINGYLIGLENPDIIKNLVQVILNNTGTKTSFSNNSLQIIQKYTIEEMARKHMAIFDHLVSTKEKT